MADQTGIRYIASDLAKRQQDVSIRFPLHRLCLDLALTFTITLILCCISKPASHRDHAEIPHTPNNNTLSITEPDAGRLAATLAVEQIGAPYRYGGRSPAGFDCSGLVHYVYGKLGIRLPRKSKDMARAGRQVSVRALLLGDLLFFRINGTRVSHVGIYVETEEFVHATKSGDPVRLDSLANPWWRERLVVVRRIF